MIYSIPVVVPANTPINKPVEVDVEIHEKVITLVRVRFPPGPSCMVMTALYYGQSQIFPQPSGAYLAGDDEVIEWHEYFELPSTPCRLTIRAWSPGTMYDHIIFWHVVALPSNVVKWWLVMDKFISVLSKVMRVKVVE